MTQVQAMFLFFILGGMYALIGICAYYLHRLVKIMENRDD